MLVGSEVDGTACPLSSWSVMKDSKIYSLQKALACAINKFTAVIYNKSGHGAVLIVILVCVVF